MRIKEEGFVGYINASIGSCPEVLVETGTYRGSTVERTLDRFRVVHTIELSEDWYRYNVDKFRDVKQGLVLHLGDSAEVLERLLPGIDEPVLCFLDAHYSGEAEPYPTAFGRDETPLLRELSAISRNRPPGAGDVIIIDDARLFGTAGRCGRDDDPEAAKWWPPMQYDWRDITLESIRRCYAADCRIEWYSEGGANEPPQLLILWPPARVSR